jgi:hypothetical protein
MSKSKNKIFIELVNRQIDPKQKKLDVKSLARISRNVDKSIFGSECVIWKGYITYIKGTDVFYINFFFNKKKHALHRLLYLNFIGDIKDNEYIKYSCDNKGKCCNINHFFKINQKKEQNVKDYEFNQKKKEINDNSKNIKKNIIENKNDQIQTVKKDNKLIIIF